MSFFVKGIKSNTLACGFSLLFAFLQAPDASAFSYSTVYTHISPLTHLNTHSLQSVSEGASGWLGQLAARWDRAAAQARSTRASTGGRRPAAADGTTAKAGGVFETVAIPFRSLPSRASWTAVYPAIAAAAFATCGPASGCGPRARSLAAAVGLAKGMTFGQKLSRINRIVNRSIAYTTDRDNYGRLDHWAEPAQILQRGKGDCEDYAILKMAALNAAGVPMNSMSIVVLQDQRRALFHAVLAVSTSQGHYILDNLHDRVMMDTALADYLPLYSMSMDRSWIHGKKRGDKLVAAIGALPAILAPGEGVADPAGAPAAGR